MPCRATPLAVYERMLNLNWLGMPTQPIANSRGWVSQGATGATSGTRFLMRARRLARPWRSMLCRATCWEGCMRMLNRHWLPLPTLFSVGLRGWDWQAPDSSPCPWTNSLEGARHHPLSDVWRGKRGAAAPRHPLVQTLSVKSTICASCKQPVRARPLGGGQCKGP